MKNTFLFTVYNKTFTIKLPMTDDGNIALGFNKLGDVSDLMFIRNCDVVYNTDTKELLKCRCPEKVLKSALPYLQHTAREVTYENLNPIFNQGSWENN